MSAILVLLALLQLTPSAGKTGSFRSRRDDVPTANVTTFEVEASLQASLQVLLRGGNSAATQRVAAIEASLWSTFQALPKNDFGRLEPRAVRHIVHTYFAKEHGWLIQGLHRHGMQTDVTEMHEVSIIQDKAPQLMEALLEAKRANHGLSLSDTVVMVSALETLIFDESAKLLQSAYKMHGVSANLNLGASALHRVLNTYLMIFGNGHFAEGLDAEALKVLKMLTDQDPTTPFSMEYEFDTFNNFEYARRDIVNPFKITSYSFQDASQITEMLADGYGKWQDTECRHMKGELMTLDHDGTGRVPLTAFYSEKDDRDYLFVESLDYLRTIGALDESAPNKPKVRIANYLQGPSNCIVSSSYYSVCCISECEGLMSELEGKVGGPKAQPSQLLDIIQNLSSSTVNAPRNLPAHLSTKLNVIADRHGGDVPIHGRLFAQWLHLAFPNECPFPHVVENLATLTPSHWQRRSAVSSASERQHHVATFSKNRTDGEFLRVMEAQEPVWSDEEILPLTDPPRRYTLRTIGRFITNAVTLVVLVRICFGAIKAASTGMADVTAISKMTNVEAKLPW